MSTTVPVELDLYLGSPVLPASVRRVRTDHRGALTFHVDSEDHDLELLRALADAVRNEPGVAALLASYGEVMDRLDAAERQGDHNLRRSLEDDATELRSQIETCMEWGSLGEGHVAVLRPAESKQLVDALTGAPAEPTVVEGSAA